MFRSGKTLKKTTDKTLYWFFINLVLLGLALLSAIFLGIFFNNKQAMDKELIGRSRSIVETIVFIRNWSARYGGVYVKKTQGMVSSPFLDNPDIESRDGNHYTLKNPALMVRELSELVKQEGLFQFHMASRKPINPANAPDIFESQALLRFEQGAKEAFFKERVNGATYFRYIAPLYVETSCLKCHAQQGYETGDVRGGLSVRFNIDSVEAAQRKNLFILFALALASFFTFSFIIHRLMHNLRRRLLEAEAKLRQIAIIDELTGLHNRRYLMQRLQAEMKRMSRDSRPFSCILFDLDHFKQVNDTYGHAAGDLVLQAVGATTRQQCRENDIPSRSGGEEFVVLLPGTPLEGALETAERLRQAIMTKMTELDDGRAVRVTASFGVATIEKNQIEHLDAGATLLKYADNALYRAKDKGRNRVECRSESDTQP